MSTRIRNFFKINLGYKIIALMLASALWLLVYNIDDPTKTTTFTIPVTITGTDVVEQMNKCYEVTGGSGQVTFAVTAKRTTLDKLTSIDFSATADMNHMVLAENGKSGSIPIEINQGRYTGSVKLSSRTKYIDVTLEDMAVKQFVVTASAKGNVAEGYALGPVSVENSNVLKVSGPVSMVQSVEKVIATIDVEGMSQNISDNVVPALYNAEGEEITSSRLSLSNTTVSVKAVILNTKQIPVRFGTVGTPAEGYHTGMVSSSADSIWIKGSAAALNRVSEISVPAETLNIENAQENLVTTIDITEYLPEGVELLDKAASTIEVSVEILKSASKAFVLPTASITIIGLAEKQQVQYNSSSVNITVLGDAAELEKLTLAQIGGTVDVTGLEPGIHNVPLTLKLEKPYSYMSVRVGLTIIKEAEPDSESSEDGE